MPVTNDSDAARTVTVRAGFDDVRVERTLTVAPGKTEVRFTPAEYRQLAVTNPKLWWPNGYGDPALHELSVELLDGQAVSDRKQTRFGIRDVSYDLSLFDHAGALRRVNVQPTNGALAGTRLIDVRHEAIKQSPKGWVESLTLAGETSPAVTPVAEVLPEPHLTIRVNGVKIAARGGNWGMDDALKRVSRDRLAPYFRLEREAHMNIVRNWMGNNNEDEFFDLADENGMMVLNDFWQSTQNFQIEPEDPTLFLANARDTISRYRSSCGSVATRASPIRRLTRDWTRRCSNSTEHAGSPAARTPSTCKARALTITARSRDILPTSPPASPWRRARRRFPRWSR